MYTAHTIDRFSAAMKVFRTTTPWWWWCFLVASLVGSVPTTVAFAGPAFSPGQSRTTAEASGGKPAAAVGATAGENDRGSAGGDERFFRSLVRPDEVRGDRYRNNETSAMIMIPPVESVAAGLGVKPPADASKRAWRRAWKIHKRALPLLHSTDSCKPPDSKLNLACMWWKGLSGNDPSSPVFDDGLAHDLLPPGWRKLVGRPLRRCFPRLHHANVELRTAYLDDRIRAIVDGLPGDPSRKVRMVCLGAGYDTRGVRMIERGTVREVFELDLPGVVTAKDRLFRRLRKRRPWLAASAMPELVPSDLNDLPVLEEILRAVLLRPPEENENDDENDDGTETTTTTTTTTKWHTIFVFEAVMIYLDETVPSALLGLTSRLLRENGLEGSLCFADRLENVPGGDPVMGARELRDNGWDPTDWCPKPGLARHMGTAALLPPPAASGGDGP